MTTNPNRSASAAHAYHTCSQYGLESRDVMVEVLRTVLSQLCAARDAHKAGRLDHMAASNASTLRILVGINDSMRELATEDPDAKTAARAMQRMCREVLMRLTNILMNPAPQSEFAALIEMLLPVYRQWQQPARP